MITPEYLNEVIEGTEQQVNRLNGKLLQDVARHIVYVYQKGGDYYMPSTIADMFKIAQSGYTIGEVQKIIEDALPDLQKEIHKAFLESADMIDKYNVQYAKLLVEAEGMDIVIPETTRTGLPASAKDLNMTSAEIRKLEAAYRRTNGTVKNICKSTALNVHKTYLQCCDDAWFKVQSGMSPGKAIMQAVDDAIKQGVTVVSYPSGHVDNIDVAIARAVRTGINQANSEIILTRCAEMGIKYVKTSKHLGARVTKFDDYTNHSWWQGRVFSLDWKADILQKNIASVPLQDKEFGYLQAIKKELQRKGNYNYPDFVESTGYGTIEGLAGINCRHTFQMWVPNINVDNTKEIDDRKNEKRFHLEQTQRRMERQMRELRREIQADKEIPLDEEGKELLRQKKKRLKNLGEKYMDFCKSNRLPYHSDRIR